MANVLQSRVFCCLATAVLLGLATNTGQLFSQTAPNHSTALTPSNGTHVVSNITVNGVHQLVVLDPAIRSLAVYHVDSTGNVQLRSVRSMVWDLKMEEFNGLAPLPSELRRVQP